MNDANNKAFEQWYTTNAFDYERNPVGSRECGLQRTAWSAALEHAAKATPSPAVGAVTEEMIRAACLERYGAQWNIDIKDDRPAVWAKERRCLEAAIRDGRVGVDVDAITTEPLAAAGQGGGDDNAHQLRMAKEDIASILADHDRIVGEKEAEIAALKADVEHWKTKAEQHRVEHSDQARAHAETVWQQHAIEAERDEARKQLVDALEKIPADTDSWRGIALDAIGRARKAEGEGEDLRKRLERAKAYIEEDAGEPCHYGDGCPTFGTRHGQCRACHARETLSYVHGRAEEQQRATTEGK